MSTTWTGTISDKPVPNGNLPIPLRDPTGKKIGTVDRLTQRGNDVIASGTITTTPPNRALRISTATDPHQCDRRPKRLLD